MFAAVTIRRSAANVLSAHPAHEDNPRLLHDAARRDASHDHPYDTASLAHALDEPHAGRGRQARTGNNAVYCVMLGGLPTRAVIGDDEWTVICKRVATAGGFEPAGDRPGTRWAALRYPSGMSALLVASATGYNGGDFRPDTEAMTAACDRVHQEFVLQDSRLPGEGDRPQSSTFVTIRDYASGVACAWGGDDLAARLLQRAGFRYAEPDEGPGRWRTPFGLDQGDRAQLTSDAVAMLRAARYHVEFDDELFVRPDVSLPANHLADPILEAAETLYFCNNAEEGAALADQVLGHGGVLVRVHEFTHSLTEWADHRLDAHDLAARLHRATGVLMAVMADMLPIPDEVRAHPQDPDTPPEFHTRRAKAANSTTTAAVTVAAPPPPGAPECRPHTSPPMSTTPTR